MRTVGPFGPAVAHVGFVVLGNDGLKEFFSTSRLLVFVPAYMVLGVLLAIFFAPIRENFIIGTLVLGGLIFLYWFFSTQEYHTSNADLLKAGDNCYFIGFVYTLAIVAVSLGTYELGETAAAGATQQGASGQDSQLESLIHSVAIALSTSVVGMIFRILLHEGTEEPEVKIEKQVENFSNAVDTARYSVDGLGGSLTHTTDHIQEAVSGMQTSTQKLHKSAEELHTAIEDVSTELKSSFKGGIRLKVDDLEGKIENIAHNCVLLEESLKSLVGLSKRVEGLEKSFESTADASGKLGQLFEKMLPGLQNSATKVRSFSDNLNNLVKALEDNPEEMKRLKGELEVELNNYKKMAVKETENLFEALGKAVEEGISKTSASATRSPKPANEPLGDQGNVGPTVQKGAVGDKA